MLTREAMLRKRHLRDEFYRRRARQSFAEFLCYSKLDYQLSWFHEELAGALDQFLDDALAKRSPRLIVCCLPQEGKSEQVSARFRHMHWAVIPTCAWRPCSYSATLAQQFLRDVQLIMDVLNYAPLVSRVGDSRLRHQAQRSGAAG